MGNRRGNYGVHEMSEWISVIDRLPLQPLKEDGLQSFRDILCIATDGKTVTTADFQAGKGWAQWGGYNSIAGNTITHWMPLPEAPKD
jgi:hypothetical protein